MPLSLRGFLRTFRSFRRHPWLHLTSIGTISVALFVLGGFFLTYRNIEVLASRTNPRILGTAYLAPDASQADTDKLREEILLNSRVLRANFKDRLSALKEVEAFLGTSHSGASGEDLFPDLIEIELKDGSTEADAAKISEFLASRSIVTDHDFSEGWLGQFKRFSQFARFFGGGLWFALLISCSFIIANFMGMRHQNRRDEIHIAGLLGAHRNFILSPFLWEGLMEGLLGALSALGALYVLKLAFFEVLQTQWASLLGTEKLAFMSPLQTASLVLLGVCMALLGGVTVFLRYREQAL